jgi:hypothetical protein
MEDNNEPWASDHEFSEPEDDGSESENDPAVESNRRWSRLLRMTKVRALEMFPLATFPRQQSSPCHMWCVAPSSLSATHPSKPSGIVGSNPMIVCSDACWASWIDQLVWRALPMVWESGLAPGTTIAPSVEDILNREKNR